MYDLMAWWRPHRVDRFPQFCESAYQHSLAKASSAIFFTRFELPFILQSGLLRIFEIPLHNIPKYMLKINVLRQFCCYLVLLISFKYLSSLTNTTQKTIICSYFSSLIFVLRLQWYYLQKYRSSLFMRFVRSFLKDNIQIELDYNKYTFSAPRFSGQSLNGSNGSTTSLASNNISFARQVDNWHIWLYQVENKFLDYYFSPGD